jgi:hypothetical protein
VIAACCTAKNVTYLKMSLFARQALLTKKTWFFRQKKRGFGFRLRPGEKTRFSNDFHQNPSNRRFKIELTFLKKTQFFHALVELVTVFLLSLRKGN